MVPIEDLGSLEATGVLTTLEQRTPSRTRQSLESFVLSVAQAREAWNIVTKTTANFNEAFRVSNYPIIYPFLLCYCILYNIV